MGKRSNAPAAVVKLVKSVMAEHHPDLHLAKVEIDVQFVHAAKDKATGLPKSPALKVHGVPALACVKILGEEERLGGGKDARITIDADRWDEHSDARRIAIIDHELEHIVIDDEADESEDAAGRPKLKIRPHNVDLGLFWSICERHGREEPQTEILLSALKKAKQLDLPFVEEVDGPDDDVLPSVPFQEKVGQFLDQSGAEVERDVKAGRRAASAAK
jgi:hypothetical protein